MKIIKKNQLAILVIALMLITAGYLNYNTNFNDNNTVFTSSEVDEMTLGSIGDATLVNSGDVIENTTNVIVDNDTVTTSEDVNPEKTTETNSASNTKSDDYFTSSKLERDTMYSQMIETYQKILDNNNISNEQKGIAQEEIKNINATQNAIMISENLIKTKGFENCIIFINDESINVVIKKEELNKEDVAQIQNIIARELNAKIQNIHITN